MAVDDDFIRREYEQQRWLADEEYRQKRETREYRRDMTANVLMAVVALAVVAAVSVLIWRGITNVDQAEVACINNGGMWASINDGGATCLRLEKQ